MKDRLEWISIKDRLPPQGVPIRIKADYGKEVVETTCTFKIYGIDEYHEVWGSSMISEDLEKYGTLRPTHWMPLPNSPDLI